MANEKEIVIATLEIDFQDDDTDGTSGQIKLEEISAEDGGEKGDYAMFLANIATPLKSHFVTSGAVSGGVAYSKEIEEYISFSNSKTASLSYPNNSRSFAEKTFIGKTYYINKKDGILKPGPTINNLEFGIDDTTFIAEKDGAIGVMKVKYTATGKRYVVTGNSVPIVVVVAIGQEKE